MGEFVAYIDSLKNYEKLGVPKGAGTDTDDGFDLGRMRRLLGRLGNPQSKFKVRTFLRVPGLCSEAASRRCGGLSFWDFLSISFDVLLCEHFIFAAKL